MKHNCEEVVRGFSEKLRARARHVVFLLGAGASCAGNLPNLSGLKERVANELADGNRKLFDALGTNRNLEEVLTRLRLLGEALAETGQTIDGIGAASAVSLDREICTAIARIVTTSSLDVTHHERFGQWLGLSQYDRPIELVTTNYDLLIEKGLEASGTPYFDGFIGTFAGRFRADLVDDDMSDETVRLPTGWVRLWKLHGSVSWIVEMRNGVNVITRLGTDSLPSPDAMLAVYPSFQKYEESRRLPFVALADRLRRSLAIPETLVVTSGYSFGDQHINELLYDAARFYPRSEIITLFIRNVPAEVVKRAESLPNLTALGAERATVGGQTDQWDCPPGETEFSKDGKFSLGDFSKLAAFLARRISTTSGSTSSAPPAPPSAP